MEGIKVKSDLPLYIQIKKYLKGMIDNSELNTGDKMPTEEMLCKKFNVSKITVIRALRDLANEGLIIRKQGKGSFVKEPDYREDVNRLADFRYIYSSVDKKAEHKLLKWHKVKANQEIRDNMKLQETDKVLEIVRLRIFQKEPVALEHTYIPESLINSVDAKKDLFKTKFVYDIFKELSQIVPENSKLFLKPIVADKHYSDVLKVSIGAPLLIYKRITYAKNEKPIEFSIFCTRGDKCEHYVQFPIKMQ